MNPFDTNTAANVRKTLKLSGKMRVIPMENDEAVADEPDEVSGTITVPKQLWGELCCLAEGVAAMNFTSTAEMVAILTEAKEKCRHIDEWYGK